MELIWPLPRVLRMFGRGMPLKSGSSRECISETPCGVAIGRFRNANNGQQVVYHALYIDRLGRTSAGSESPQKSYARTQYSKMSLRHACQALGLTPSRCTARRNVPAGPSEGPKFDALALRCSPKLWAFPIVR